jgi:peptide/nickel transport system substrate-binding protein
MRRFGWQLFVVSSLLVATLSPAETRPLYGGTLHVATRIAPSTLDPADGSLPDSIARRNLLHLIFDTLVVTDDRGRLQPALATSWKAEPGNRWQFWLRSGVKFHDGSPLTPDAVAAPLRAANPGWNVFATNEAVVIQSNVPDFDLPAELTVIRNAIVKRGPGGSSVGTGPFHVTGWQPGKSLSLAAEEGYWGGRPFLDTIEVELAKTYHDQLIEFDLGKIDVVEVAPEEAHRLSEGGRRVVESAPVELMALVFPGEPLSSDAAKVRDVLALSIDRASIRSVVLQDTGEPSGGILPNWISGYAFIFPSGQDLARAREERSEIQRSPALTLGYDSSDALARVIAERIALNARDAGLTLQTTSSATSDIRLETMTLASDNPSIALTSASTKLGTTTPQLRGTSIDDLYKAEDDILQTRRVVPLFQLPMVYTLNNTVRGWTLNPDGRWHLADVWLGSDKH